MSDFSSMANLPFKVGQLAEERRFVQGCRGAWFRCKIKEITKRKRMFGHIAEYYDDSGSKSQWTKLYKVNKSRSGQPRELMLRPEYPPIYNEKQMPHASEVSEVIVIVSDSWKVGDLVDWWNTHCFRCGIITELLNDQEAQIELHPPPFGEGESYRVDFMDLRPSLDWSLEQGWTLPIQEDGTQVTQPPCARLIKPINQVIDRVIRVDDTNSVGEETADVQKSAGVIASMLLSSPVSSNLAVSSEVKSKKTTEINRCFRGTTLSKEPKGDIEKSSSQGCGDSNIRKRSQANAYSRQSTAEQEVEVVEEDLNRRNHEANGRGALNLKHSDTLEATILDLEKCLNKVKSLKKLLLR